MSHRILSRRDEIQSLHDNFFQFPYFRNCNGDDAAEWSDSGNDEIIDLPSKHSRIAFVGSFPRDSDSKEIQD